MRWQGSRKSQNLDDYRGQRFGGAGLKLGVGGTLIALVAGYFLGIDPRVILGLVQNMPAVTEQQGEPVGGVPSDEQGQFIAAVLGETEDTWSASRCTSGVTTSSRAGCTSTLSERPVESWVEGVNSRIDSTSSPK